MERVIVQNVSVPGYQKAVDAKRYQAMRHALQTVLPPEAPGLTMAEMFQAVLEHLPQTLFPGGDKVSWWMKTVQLDLEAKGLIAREPTRPVRWHRTQL